IASGKSSGGVTGSCPRQPTERRRWDPTPRFRPRGRAPARRQPSVLCGFRRGRRARRSSYLWQTAFRRYFLCPLLVGKFVCFVALFPPLGLTAVTEMLLSLSAVSGGTTSESLTVHVVAVLSHLPGGMPDE